MGCVIKRQHRWALGSCVLLVAFALVGAGCGDSVDNCGNGLIEGTEECDGSNLGEETCVTQGFVGGSLGCQADCTFDTSLCTGGPVCGDNIAEGTEVCDGTDLAGEDCASQGFTGGTLGCLADCSGFDISSCTGCGNDVVEPPEQCDGVDLQGLDCTDFVVFTGGTLACTPECTFDTSGCTGPVCGDNIAEGAEVCDGTDLGFWTGLTCEDAGFTGGTLACNATCDNFDATACTGGPAGWTCDVFYYGTFDGCDCGCGVLDPDCIDGTVGSCEFCGAPGSCSPLGLDCPGDIDPAQNWLCEGGTAVCGDGVAEPPEQCDGGDVQGLDCTDFGFTEGTLACNNCTFDTSACTGGPVCGDDTIQAPEVCDGTDLGFWTGLTCEDAGFTGGTLACNATCDNLDLTACTGGPAGWTCDVFYYGTFDGCDCGCGVLDPDCIDGTVGSCEYCSEPGSCTPIDAGCPGDIDPAQNWLCGGSGGTGGVGGNGGSGGG
jgi:hypothetical protein